MTRHAAREAAQGARRVDHGLIPQEDETMVLYGYIMMVNIMMIDNG
jgi:phosphatidylserine decarboxylase